MKSEIEKDPFQTAAPREARRKRTGGENLAQEASEYIEAHFREKFSLQKMADSLYINGSYLLRAFKKYKGYTPLVYHNHIRCERAKELLARTDEEISEIGEAVGFVSSAHFSHVFKKTEDCTPTEYRISHRVYREEEEA
jgi:two-component system response regulator YesN